jgi:hypothetical protein
MKTKLLAILALTALSTLNSQLSASPLGTAFNYQGRLADGTNPAQGIYDFRFAIYDSDSGGSAVAGPLTNAAVAVSNGLFTVMLDFGNAFDGNARWLELGVRSNGSPADFTLLAPRQPVNPTPYARYASKAGEAAMATDVPNGSITAVKIAAEAVKSTHLAPGAVTSAGIADGTITDVDISSSGISGNKIVGGDLQALRLKVGSSQTLLGDWSTIAGGQINVVEAGATSSAIGGGMGNAILTNASYSAIGGGQWNVIWTNSVGSAIAGGLNNSVAVNASLSAIGGGQWNKVQSTQSAIGGGGGNVIYGGGGFNTIAGGTANTISNGNWSTTIAGGQNNTAQPGANYSTIAGGIYNEVGGWHSFAAGYRAKALHNGSFVWGDSTEADVASTANNQFMVRATGGVRFDTGGSGVTLDEGAIELGNSLLTNTMPHIDFHYGVGTNQDYNVRLLNYADGQLWCVGQFGVVGADLITSKDSDEGGSLVLHNLRKTGAPQAGAWKLFNMTGIYGDGLALYTFHGSGSVARRLFIGDDGTTVLAPSGGNVGIGTASPENPLEVNGSIKTSGGPGNAFYKLPADSGHEWWNGAFTDLTSWQIVHRRIADASWTAPLTILTNGNVGIGTASPTATLEVAGTVKATGFTGDGAALTGISGAALANGSVAGSKLAPGDVGLTSLNTASVDTRYVKKAGDTMTGTLAIPANGLQAGGSQLVLASGNVGIGEASPVEKLVVGQGGNILLKASGDDAGDIIFQTSTGTQKGRVYTAPAAGQNKLHLTSGDNIPDITIGTNGYVGIATENPQSALHVNGSLQLDKTGPELGRLILNTVSRNDPGRYGILFSNNLLAPFLGDDTQPITFSFRSGWSIYRTNDATLSVHGKASGTWGNYLSLTHNGTNGLIKTDVGDLLLAPAGGNVQVQTLTITSDRGAKRDFAPVDAKEILQRVASVPIQTWAFKNQPGTRHIGPVAQDFYAAFSVGADDKHIATVDADGAALAAIQGLYQIVKEKDTEIGELKRRLAAVESALAPEQRALLPASSGGLPETVERQSHN